MPTRKTETLLSYLALEPAPHSRGHSSNPMWSDRSDQQARNSLRQALNALMKLFKDIEPNLLQIEHRGLYLASQSIEIDAVKLEELIDEHAPQAVAATTNDRVLTDWNYSVCLICVSPRLACPCFTR